MSAQRKIDELRKSKSDFEQRFAAAEAQNEALVDELQRWKPNAEKRFANLAAGMKVLVNGQIATQINSLHRWPQQRRT
jgi:hypothetical protein